MALALPLAAVLEQKLANVAIGAVSGVNSMTELSRAWQWTIMGGEEVGVVTAQGILRLSTPM